MNHTTIGCKWVFRKKKKIKELIDTNGCLEKDNKEFRKENIRLGGIVDNLNEILKEVLNDKRRK